MKNIPKNFILSIAIACVIFAVPFVYDLYGNTAWGHCFTIASSIVALALGASALVVSKQKQIHLSISDIIVAAIGIYLAISTVTTKNDVLATNIALCLAVYLLGRLSDKIVLIFGVGIAGVAQAVLVIAQWAHIIDSNHALFDVTGSFGNPAQVAGFMTMTLFATAYCAHEAYKSQKRGWTIVGACAVAVQLVALYATSSRAAWVGVIAAIVWAVSAKLRPITRVATLGVICAVAAIGLSQIRSESALGRLLIWRASVPMITEAPILGNGHNSFEKNYMFAQADYFEQNPNSPFVQAASNVGYPFNDSLRILVEQGAIGLILFALLIISLLWSEKNRERLWLQCGVVAFVVYA
ncbi:MAG: O-antigen ligase family protein, partial [Rikenellaceae bacterium]|nr:O-antigen ligase family protein [Rikenellaceae bacterium]